MATENTDRTAPGDAIREKLIHEYTESYMEKIFYFCLKKTSDRYEAEDLAQDISLNVILSLSKYNFPENLSAYVWRIARNRYSVWADKKHKSDSRLSPCDIYEQEIVDESDNFLEDMIHAEELALLRRELAFISSDYRNVIVAYYLENRSIRDIASSLSLPDGTVKSKLSRARKLLKEGMNMAREFGKRSYNPEEISFTNSCSAFGDNGQPWSILSHALYKNIFLEAYDNPSSAEELSLELGVALPYMEEELEFLTEETFLVKTGSKYETAFPIIGKEAQEEIYEYNMAVAGQITKLISELVDEFSSACSAHGIDLYGGYQSYGDAKWTLLIHTFDKLMADAAGEWNYEYTKRPYHGRWDIVGYKNVEKNVVPCIGRHGNMYNSIPNSENIDFMQYKFAYENIQAKTPPYLSYEEAVTLKRLAEGNTDGLNEFLLDNLVKYGYARRTDAGYEPTIIIFRQYDGSVYLESFTDSEKESIRKKAEMIREMLSDASVFAINVTKKDLPQIFKKDERMCSFACRNCMIDGGQILYMALKNNLIKYDESTAKAVGAYIYLAGRSANEQ